MRLVHTADWHLGQSFGPFTRDAEHARFLAWLLDVLEQERADALLICGDIFETGNPPPLAQRRYYEFLASARRRMPALGIVVIGGNHDAPHRLDAPSPILEPFGVRVVGALPRLPSTTLPSGATGPIDVERCLVPLRGPSGDIEALCAAVPFLRMADLDPVQQGEPHTGDPVVDGVMSAYARVLDGAQAELGNGEALIALGHGLLAGGQLTDESERPVFGNAHALPVEMFPREVAYVALGHLHRAQVIAEAPLSSSSGSSSELGRVRYSGSPIPLSMTERGYRHQVLVVELEGPRLAAVRAREVPRTVDVLRVPGDDSHGPLDDVLDRLRALEVAAAGAGQDDVEPRPFLEVRVRLDAPTPDVRARVEEALEGKHVRLLRVRVELAGEGGALADKTTPAPLGDIEPMRVLEGLYKRTFGGEVPPEIAAAFGELVEDVRAEKANASELPTQLSLGIGIGGGA